MGIIELRKINKRIIIHSCLGGYCDNYYFWLGPVVDNHYTGYCRDELTDKQDKLILIGHNPNEVADAILVRIFEYINPKVENDSMRFSNDPRKKDGELAELLKYLVSN